MDELERRDPEACFRPLAGMNCFINHVAILDYAKRFRPLAGMNCFSKKLLFSSCLLA